MRSIVLGIGVALSLVAGAQDLGKSTVVNGQKFVGACPNVTETIARKPGPVRVMVIGAHPDDADISTWRRTRYPSTDARRRRKT